MCIDYCIITTLCTDSIILYIFYTYIEQAPTHNNFNTCDVHKCTNSIHNVFEVYVHVFVCNISTSEY